jgi:group I intron endonuclease
MIINKQNGHKYVGQTTEGMNKRWQQHIQESLRMCNQPLHKAMRNYGNHNFIIKQIDECDENLLNEREQYWIKYYNTSNINDGYNTPEIPEVEEIKKEIKPKPNSWGCLTEKNRGNGKHCGIRIQGLNIETGEIKEWDNARDAAEEITGDRSKNSNIILSAKKGYKCYGYRWKLLEKKSKKKAVKAVNKITWQEYHFESCADAIRQVCKGNCLGTGLYKALKSNGRYTWKGHMWFYI